MEKTVAERLAEGRKNRQAGQSSIKHSSTNSVSERLAKSRLGKTINFDTFESDLKSLGTTVESVYNGWQDQDTMNNTKASIVSMQERLNAYQEYAKLFGGEDVTELANGYKTILEDWDNRSSVYGQYKNADAYNVANKKVQLEKQFTHKDGSGYTFEEVQAELKKYAPDSDEYKYLSTYTNYSDLNDFNKAMGSDGVVSIQNEIAALKAEKEKLDSDYKANGGYIPSASNYNRPAQNQVAPYQEWQAKSTELENKIKELEDAGYYGELKTKKNLRELEHKVDLYKPEYEGKDDFEKNSKYVTTYNKDKSQYGDLTYEYINNVDGAREEIQLADEMENRNGNGYMSQWQKSGYDLLREDEIAIYNYKYRVEGKDSANKFLEDMQTVLDKRRTDKLSASWEENAEKLPILSNAATVIMKPAGAIVGAIDDAVNSLQGKEYNPYSYAHTTSNYVSDTRKYTSEDIEENTNLELFGQNIASFLYNTGMSLADSAYGVATVGKLNSVLMGTSAFQDKAKELVASGADQDAVWKSAITSGVAETLFEHIGIDNLFKIKNVDSLSSFVKNALKQAGAEGAEEIGTEITNIIADDVIRGKDSELYKKYNDLLERGYSEKEALSKTALQAGSQVAWAGIGGALSGMAMGGVAGGKNYSENKTIGKEIRGNNRVTDMLDIASLSPQESDAYAAYTEYANRGVNAENITDAQLGNLYGMVEGDAASTVFSKKATKEQKADAETTYNRLTKMKTENKAAKTANELAQTDDEGVVTPATREMVINEQAKGMSEAEANLFRLVDDGHSNAADYADSFNLVVAMAQNEYDQDYILEHRGVLSTAQVNSIYQSVVTNPKMAQQKRLNALIEEQGDNLEIKGTIDDSVIDYDNTGAEGKINWNSLHPNVKATIAYVSGFATKVAGMDVQLVTNGRDYGFTGRYDRQGNNMFVDITALTEKVTGADTKGRKDNSKFIISTVAHEVTHWMEEKAPELYAQYDKMVMDALTSGSLTESDVLAYRRGKLEEAEAKRAKKENRKPREITDKEVRREVIARASEDMLALSEEGKKYFESLSENEQKQIVDKIKEVIQNIKDWIKNVLSNLKSEAPEAELLRLLSKDLDAISKKWDEMLRQAAKANAAMKKAGVNDTAIMESKDGVSNQNADIDETHGNFIRDKYFDRQIDKIETLKKGGYVTVGEIKTDSPINKVGIPAGNLYFDVSKIRQEMIDRKDNIPPEIMKGIPTILDNPILITEYTDNDGIPSINVYGNLFIGSSPVVVGIMIGKHRNGSAVDKIQTVHPNRNVLLEATDENTLYLGENKKETKSWFQALGTQTLPLGGTKFGFIRSINQNPPKVKSFVQFSDIDDFNIDDYTIDDLLKMSDEDFQKAYSALGLDDLFASDESSELYGGESISIEDVSEELNTEPEKIEILVRREGLGASHVEENRTAVMTKERIDRGIKESSARFSPDYSRRYITSISTKDFIDLTVLQKNMDRKAFDTNVEGDSGSKMGDFDYESALRNEEQSPYLSIDRSTGRIIGHNGRHRIRALEMAGIEAIEIEIEFYDEDGSLIKYNSETIPDLAISSQFDTAIETHISNIIPLNETHRAEVESAYGEKAHGNAGVQYSDIDEEYMDAVEKGNMAVAQRLVDNAAKKAGYDRLMFHETDADNIHIFDVSRGTHGGTDSETPYGIFTKTSVKNIGLGSYQMALYVKAKNTLYVENREEVKEKIPELVPYYDEIARIDKEYEALAEEYEDAEFEALQEWMDENPDADMDVVYPTSYIIEKKPADIDSQKYLDAHRKHNETMEAWTREYDKLAVKCKEIITEHLRNNGYDSMYFKVDGGSRGRQTDSLILLDSNQVKSAAPVTKDDNGNVIPLSKRFNASNDDIRYSDIDEDSQGNKLSAEQQAFFKNSVVRDEKGKLKVMYHGTPNAGFTKFRSGTYFTEHKWYADKYQSQGASSLSYKNAANNPDTYAVYLNIKKPFDTRNKVERDIFYNEYYRQWGTGTDLMESGLPDWLDGQDLQEFLEENGYDYDGLILDEGGTGGYGEEVTSRGLSYVVFSPEQVKDVDNVTPTTDPDYRYSDIDDLDDLNAQLREKQNQIYSASMELRKFDAKAAEEKLYAVLKKDGASKQELDAALQEYAKWGEESGYADASAKLSALKDEEKLLRREIQKVEDRLHDELKEQIAHWDEEDVKKYVAKAVRKYHTTTNLEKASYLVTTGSMLDFSDGQGYRVKDHREISEILDLPDYAKYSDGMIAFMNMGNIRLQTYGIDVSAMPNAKQFSTLRDIIFKVMRENDEFSVDFSKTDGYSAGSVTYGKGTSASKIIADIKSYFETGVVPEEQSSIRDFLYSDIDVEVDIYEVLGENKRLNKENKAIREDVDRLKERLKLERQLTHGNRFNENQLDAVAGHIRNLGNSNYSKPELINKLREVYTHIATSNELSWDDLFARFYGIAEDVLGEARPVYSPNDYYANIYRDLRNTEISLSDGQKKEFKDMMGVDAYKAFFGKIKVSDKGIPLNSKWEEWAAKYPNEFAETNDKNQVLELLEIYETAKELKEVVEEYDVVERTRWLANEIYNQYWNVSPIRTTADKYDKQIKRLNYEHRNAMKELRDSYNERLEKQKKADRAERSRIFKKLREDHIKELKEIRQSGKERLDKYKEEAARKTRIQSVTANSLTLNEWLVKNSKDKHIHESMKGPVIALLQAIDFSSKRALGMWGGDMSGVPTNKDISLQKALSQVQQMMADASVGKEDLILLYGHELDADIKAMVESVDNIMRNVGDNEFILNKMTLNDLITLDNVVKTIKHAVTQMNKFHTVHHAKGIANLAQEEIIYAEKLGKAKIYTDKSFKAGVKKLLAWKNINPYYAFKRFGAAGKKIFEAFQDGYDKFAFNIKEIIDFTNSTYKAKEVQEWEKEIKTFKLRMPATEEQLARADYQPEYQDVKMTVAQIMDLYLLNKREAARVHLLGGGIRVADIETKGSEVISQSEGAVLEQSEIDAIIKTLTPKQIEVADALSKFMNTTTTDWGNEVSMARFGYKAFGEKNYVPMQVDKNNLAVDDETEKNNSLFRLLNMSFTKSLTEGANNRLVISSIFDVFAQHTSDMAKYNALALPVLDAFRWYNYKEKGYKGETAYVTKSVKQAIENAFGKDGQSYITTFLKDLNGQENTSRDTIGKSFFTKAKIAAVGANIRVALLQPTAYLKASANIDNKYLIKALFHKPKIGRAEQYCGMALWKSLGYFDTNVQRGVAEQIKHAETWRDKAVELSMKGAEWGDKITFGYLWNAAELEVREKRTDLKVGSDEFYFEVGKRLRDIIYSTQVVDSVMTRSEMMRSPDWGDKLLTTFASEPTIAYNMLADAYMQTQLDARELGSKKAAIKKNAKHMARVVVAYTVTNLVAALVESGFDALRDDDDEEMDGAEFMKLYFENFATNQSITAKIPWLKEAVSIFQGFSSTRMDTQWIQTFSNTLKQVSKLMQGEGSPTKLIKNSLQTISYAFGLPFYNAYRDFMAILNKLDILTAEELDEILEDFIG